MPDFQLRDCPPDHPAILDLLRELDLVGHEVELVRRPGGGRSLGCYGNAKAMVGQYGGRRVVAGCSAFALGS